MLLLKPDVSALVAGNDTRTLIRASRHWSGKIRMHAAAALGALRTVQAVPNLISLLADQRADVREAAARALGDIGRKEAVDPLIGALKKLKRLKVEQPELKEYEYAAISEALGRLNVPRGIAAVMEAGTESVHEGFFNVSRPHIGGLCLSGCKEARAALLRVVTEHYLYDSYALVLAVEALDYLREPRAASAFIDIVNTCGEWLLKSWTSPNDPESYRNRNIVALALAAARALGRLETKRAEPVLLDLLLHVPAHPAAIHPHAGRTIAEIQHAILTIRGEKSRAEFDCARGTLKLAEYEIRRHLTDIEYGGAQRWDIEANAAKLA
jgi:hypothetical protein